MKKANGGSSRLAAISAAIAASLWGCEPGVDETCPTYACVNAGKLSGELRLPAATERVDAKFCRTESSCIEGLLELSGASTEPVCTEGALGGWGDGVCVTRSAQGELQLQASLYLGADAAPPPDGEEYSLLLVDHDSGEVLVDEVRAADYEVTRVDSCHSCWDARMTL